MVQEPPGIEKTFSFLRKNIKNYPKTIAKNDI